MSIPGLPRGKRSQVFRAVEAILRADPVLAAVVKTWLSFDGSGSAGTPTPNDKTPVNSLEPPFPGTCPWIRLSLTPRRIVRADTSTYELPVGIRIEVATAGEVIDDQSDLWEAIMAAMMATKPYLDTTVELYLRTRAVTDTAGNPLPGQGACDWYFEDSAISPVPQKEDPAMLVGVGALVLTVRVPA